MPVRLAWRSDMFSLATLAVLVSPAPASRRRYPPPPAAHPPPPARRHLRQARSSSICWPAWLAHDRMGLEAIAVGSLVEGLQSHIANPILSRTSSSPRTSGGIGRPSAKER